MRIDQAIQCASENGWLLQHYSMTHAVVAYDDGGAIARSMDRRRGRGNCRASITLYPDGSVRTRLLSKWTTDLLHWIRYFRLKSAISAQNTQYEEGWR